MSTKKIILTIDEDIVKDLDEKAKEASRSRNNYINRIIVEHLQFEEIEKKLQDRISELEKQLIIQSIPQQVVTPLETVKQPIEETIKPLNTSVSFNIKK